MKKLPLAFSGCLLDWLEQEISSWDIFPLLSHIFSLSGLILWFYFLVSHLNNWHESKQELKKNRQEAFQTVLDRYKSYQQAIK